MPYLVPQHTATPHKHWLDHWILYPMPPISGYNLATQPPNTAANQACICLTIDGAPTTAYTAGVGKHSNDRQLVVWEALLAA